MSKTGPRELTNENDPSIAELCNPDTGEIMSIATRHDGGKRADALRAKGWRVATEADRAAALERAAKNAGEAGDEDGDA